MTTINFPISPLTNDEYTVAGRTWVFNGVGWVSKAVVPGGAILVNRQTGTTYTLVLADAGKRVSMSNAAANVLTIPPNSSVAIPVNTVITVSQDGAGATSIAPGAGVTINTSVGLNVGGQHRMVSLYKDATDTWIAVGTIA